LFEQDKNISNTFPIFTEKPGSSSLDNVSSIGKLWKREKAYTRNANFRIIMASE